MWWLGPAAFALILLYFAYVIFRPRPPTEEDLLEKHDPLPVPPERAALGVEARLRLPEISYHGRVERFARHLAWRPDGTVIAGVTRRGLRFFRGEDGGVFSVGQLRVWGSGPPHAIAWSHAGEHLVIANRSTDGDILHWIRFPDMKILAHRRVDRFSMDRIAFSPDDDLVAWAGSNRVGVWDPAQDEVREIEGPDDLYDMAIVRYRGGLPAILTHSGRGTFERWDPVSMERLSEIDPRDERSFVGFLAEGRYGWYHGHDVVRIRNTEAGEVVAERKMDGYEVESAWTDRRLELVVLGRKDGRILLWDPGEDRILADVKAADQAICEIAGEPGDRIATAAGFDNTQAEIWSVHRVINAARRG